MEASGDPSEVIRQIKFHSIIHIHNLRVRVPFHIHSNAYTNFNSYSAYATLIKYKLVRLIKLNWNDPTLKYCLIMPSCSAKRIRIYVLKSVCRVYDSINSLLLSARERSLIVKRTLTLSITWVRFVLLTSPSVIMWAFDMPHWSTLFS